MTVPPTFKNILSALESKSLPVDELMKLFARADERLAMYRLGMLHEVGAIIGIGGVNDAALDRGDQIFEIGFVDQVVLVELEAAERIRPFR